MTLMDKVKLRVKKNPQVLVLPEPLDLRVLKAAAIINQEGFSKEIILLGNETEINKKANETGTSLSKIRIIDPLTFDKKTEYAETYCELRSHKTISFENARKMVENPLCLAALMVKKGEAATFVAGAINTTANVLRTAIHIIGTAPGLQVVSGAFIMIVPDCPWGENGIFAFADSAVVPDPDPRQLADIAAATAKMFRVVVQAKPRIAMLSFSTKGSAQHKLVTKVIEAAKIVSDNYPDLEIDGELQLDAAIIPEIACRKSPHSPVAGKANVLIFPDLNSGNIAYKIVERLAKAKAYGPLLQGFATPVSDLSRGCNVTDIVETAAITLLRAHEEK